MKKCVFWLLLGLIAQLSASEEQAFWTLGGPRIKIRRLETENLSEQEQQASGESVSETSAHGEQGRGLLADLPSSSGFRASSLERWRRQPLPSAVNPLIELEETEAGNEERRQTLISHLPATLAYTRAQALGTRKSREAQRAREKIEEDAKPLTEVTIEFDQVES